MPRSDIPQKMDFAREINVAQEINFDGLIGPTHNYAGLSLGNLAATGNAGNEAHPRAAALQGLAKMRHLIDLGIPQGFLPPPLRPAAGMLRSIGYTGSDRDILLEAADEDRLLFRSICSASSMWAANAATVIAAADSRDGRVHLVTANLATMLHRAAEAPDTCQTLQAIFADDRHFAVHPPLPLGMHFADEGAANHMRLTRSHGTPGLNIFVHGAERGGRFPERQAARASRAAARLAGLPADRAIFTRQSADAIQAGAFHNDVVAVANETVLLAHPEAFADRPALFGAIRLRVPEAQIVEVQGITLADAVASYLFNAQIVSLPGGGMALILPSEAQENPKVWRAIDRALGGCAAITRLDVVNVRESMRNGGGPACLRLRVPVSAAALAAIHPGYLLTPQRWEALTRLVETLWPETVAPGDLLDPALWELSKAVQAALRSFVDNAV